jgi:CRP-like cAMP-binding protein
MSTDEYDQFIGLAKTRKLERGDFLLQAGSSVDKLFFIKSGIIRGYRIINGEDITHHFFIEDWLATDYVSYLTQEPGELYLECLTEVKLYEFKKKDIRLFYSVNSKFEKLRYIQAEDAFLQMVERLKDFQTKNLKERYLNLITKNPKLFNQVPQKYIASFLGVKPQSLSRIKDSIKSV